MYDVISDRSRVRQSQWTQPAMISVKCSGYVAHTDVASLSNVCRLFQGCSWRQEGWSKAQRPQLEASKADSKSDVLCPKVFLHSSPRRPLIALQIGFCSSSIWPVVPGRTQ